MQEIIESLAKRCGGITVIHDKHIRIKDKDNTNTLATITEHTNPTTVHVVANLHSCPLAFIGDLQFYYRMNGWEVFADEWTSDEYKVVFRQQEQ